MERWRSAPRLSPLSPLSLAGPSMRPASTPPQCLLNASPLLRFSASSLPYHLTRETDRPPPLSRFVTVDRARLAVCCCAWGDRASLRRSARGSSSAPSASSASSGPHPPPPPPPPPPALAVAVAAFVLRRARPTHRPRTTTTTMATTMATTTTTARSTSRDGCRMDGGWPPPYGCRCR